MSDKHFISAQSLLEDSWRLAANILKDKFHPNFIVGVWRGGTPVGIAVQEMLDFYGVHTDHISIRTSSYSGKSRLDAPVRVHGLDYLINNKIRIATPYFKPAKNRTSLTPHYYIHETDRWLVFPHEIDGLNRAEVMEHKAGLIPYIDELDAFYDNKSLK